MSNGINKPTYDEIAQALTDLLDCAKSPRDIQADTGLPMERCDEIHSIGLRLASVQVQPVWADHKEFAGLTNCNCGGWYTAEEGLPCEHDLTEARKRGLIKE
jgi:hypothetical protein